jgi:MFS family permease
MMGLTSSAIMLGSVIGPLLGGLLSAAVGIRWVFVVAAAVLAVSATGARRFSELAPPKGFPRPASQ